MQHHQRRRRLWTGAVAIVALCVQYTVFLMSLPEDKEKAHWNELEVSALVDYFYQRRSEVGEGGNFRAKTYNAAGKHIASYLSQGPKKTARMCKMKWFSIMHLYTAIENYRDQPGFHWDNDHGAGIEGDAAASVWSTYTQQEPNSVLRPYRNRGWEHYDKVQGIIPSNCARGTHAFHPSLTKAPSLVDDEDDEGVDASGEGDGGVGDEEDQDRDIDGDDDDEEGNVSAAVAIHGLQGSINRLIDILIMSMTTPPDSATTRTAQAVRRVQDVDDGLSTMEKVELIRQFEKNEASPGTYLSLKDQALRQAWIRTKLESMIGGTAM